MLMGIVLAALSGVCLGTCFLPMRYMKPFAWENTWFVWAFTGCVVFPPLIAWLTIPSLVTVLAEVGLRLNLVILGVGLIAETSGILFGRALAKIGMALANLLSNGVSLASTNLAAAGVEYSYGDWQGPALHALSYGLLALTLSIGTFAWSSLLVQ